jgi:hypothetical protein
MHAEAQLVRRERAQRRRSAHVRYPRARLEGTRHGRNGRVGYAEKHELGTAFEHGDATLAQASGDRGPDAAGADDLNRVERLPYAPVP